MAYSYTGYSSGAPGMSSTGSAGLGEAGGGGGGSVGSGLGKALPWAQLALQLYSTLSKPGMAETMSKTFKPKVEAALASQGERGQYRDVNAPSILSKKKQAGMQAGEFALNFVPAVGPALSAGASAARAAKTSAAQQKFIERLIEANPALNQQGGVQLKSEYVPQNNWLANYANSQPKFMQSAAEKTTKALTGGEATGFSSGAKEGAKRGAMVGTVLMPGIGTILGGLQGGLMGGVGAKVFGSKKKQEEKQLAIHLENVKKLKEAKLSAEDEQTFQKMKFQRDRGTAPGIGETLGPGLMQNIGRQLTARMGPGAPPPPPRDLGPTAPGPMPGPGPVQFFPQQDPYQPNPYRQEPMA